MTEVYKIKIVGTGISDFYSNKTQWVSGFNGSPKTGGSGKTFTSKKLVNRMFELIKGDVSFGVQYMGYIVTYQQTELSISDDVII